MKTTNLRTQHESMSIPDYVNEYMLGTIATHDITGEQIESTVTMSERNFRLLLDMIPKSSTIEATVNAIKRFKDKLTTKVYNGEINRKLYIEALEEEMHYQTFLNDVEELNSVPQIVGKINLNKKSTSVDDE